MPPLRSLLCRPLLLLLGLPAAVVAADSIFETMGPATPASRIDELVLARLQQLGLEPARPAADAVFVRRAFLDVIGTLPTAEEARGFLRDPAPDKRRVLIDQLLERPEFADYWAMKWSDLLRVKAEFPINLWPNAAQAYHHWIRTAVRDDLPYDRFARELLTASGSNFRQGPVNFYRAMQNHDATGIAATVALTFLGARVDKWTAERRTEFAGFFTQVGYKATGEWKEEIVFFDPTKTPAPASSLPLPDGTTATLAPGQDPREALANWLVSDQNPWFSRVMANRAWAWLVGRGIVHEPDDFRPDNPPSNPALLDFLAEQLVAARYDVKQLFRLILNSRTYQFSSVPAGDCLTAEAEANFAFYPLRRLDAEVLIDALNQITGSTESYSSPIPEPFTFIPEDQRSIGLPDGSITSAFLETFGRPPRDTGLEAERNNRLNAPQRLHLLNSTHVQRKIERGPRLQALLRTKAGSREVVDTLYYTILSRPPTPAERNAITAYARTAGLDPRAAALDLAWALINSTEFLHRH